MEKKGYRDNMADIRDFIEEQYGENDKRRALSPEDVAVLLGVGIDTVYKMLKNKKNPLPSIRAGRYWKIPVTAIARRMCGD